MEYKEFVSKSKSLCIAPAGYGKTHTIAECLNHCDGKQLILTHTHAGIASIKEKIKKVNLPTNTFHIETITGYAQKYVKAFYHGTDVPSQENGTDYYPFIIKKATELVRIKPISSIITLSYSGLFVDEYQDCTVPQHNFILALSEILPTHILGDPLQGIFEFNEPLVDFTLTPGMSEFLSHSNTLTEPKRWERTNPTLGNSLKAIRVNIEAGQPIDLRNHKSSIEVIIIQHGDLYNPQKEYYKKIWKLLGGEKNLLVLHPISGSTAPRLKVLERFGNLLTLVEAIDDKDFYGITALLDLCNKDNIDKTIRDICCEFGVFSVTRLKKDLFNDTGVKNTRRFIADINDVKSKITQYKIAPSLKLLSQILQKIKTLSEVKCFRPETHYAICHALEDAEQTKITVKEAMINRRNMTRRVGRKIYGRCIGTTLLTKGLEFETVAILDAHTLTCPKNLYVALTRATKKLIIFTTNPVLFPQY